MSYINLDYDGTLIHSRFGYTYFRKHYNPLGVVLITRGNMDVKEALIDLEDKHNDDFIKSNDALNVCWEIPNMNAIGAVFFQRLFAKEVGNLLANRYVSNCDVDVRGDDIMIKKRGTTEYGKASVSITKVTDGVALGHLGLNINAGPEAPSFAFSLFLNDNDTALLARDIKELFDHILQDCFIATTKVI